MDPCSKMKRITTAVCVLFLFPLSFQCKKKAPKAPVPAAGLEFPKKYQGLYRLQPAVEKALIELDHKGVAIYQAGRNRRRGSYMAHRGVLRIFIRIEESSPISEPSGVFLLDDFDPTGWKGRWLGDAAELIRASGPHPHRQ